MEAILGCLFGIFAGYTTSVLFCINKINATEREIANKKAMIKNRDEAIEKLKQQRDKARKDYDTEIKRVELQDKQIECIKIVLEQNSYSRDDLKISKIKELVSDYQSQN